METKKSLKSILNEYLTRFKKWCVDVKPMSEFILMLVGVITILSYIIVSSIQSYQTNEAINSNHLSDSLNNDFRQRELRAYFGLNEITGLNRLNDKTISVDIQFENYGKTPAYDVSIICSVYTNKELKGINKQKLNSYYAPSQNFIYQGVMECENKQEMDKLIQGIQEQIWIFKISGFLYYRTEFHKKDSLIFSYDYDILNRRFVYSNN